MGNGCSPGCRLWCFLWIWDLTESVSEGFLTYSFIERNGKYVSINKKVYCISSRNFKLIIFAIWL